MVAGQWRVVPRHGLPGLILGLDYTAAEAGLRLGGIEVTPTLWDEIRLIEASAVDALNED